jgi:hypothetical protein
MLRSLEGRPYGDACSPALISLPQAALARPVGPGARAASTAGRSQLEFEPLSIVPQDRDLDNLMTSCPWAEFLGWIWPRRAFRASAMVASVPQAIAISQAAGIPPSHGPALGGTP